MCGIAGFGSCQIYLPGKGIHTCIDFHGKTPLGATPEMWEDRVEGEARDGFGFVLRNNVNDLGYQAITAPGSLLAYFEAVRDFGTWDWADICGPAIAQAEALSESLVPSDDAALLDLQIAAARRGLDARDANGASFRELARELLEFAAATLGGEDSQWAEPGDLEAIADRLD